MSNYATLKSAIQSAVYTNGNGEITGAGLQAVLLQIVNTVGDGYVFKGVATPGTSPGTPDNNVFYIAPAGTYDNFGSSYTVPDGSVGVFTYDGSWSRTSVEVGGMDKFLPDILASNADIGIELSGVDYENNICTLTVTSAQQLPVGTLGNANNLGDLTTVLTNVPYAYGVLYLVITFNSSHRWSPLRYEASALSSNSISLSNGEYAVPLAMWQYGCISRFNSLAKDVEVLSNVGNTEAVEVNTDNDGSTLWYGRRYVHFDDAVKVVMDDAGWSGACGVRMGNKNIGSGASFNHAYIFVKKMADKTINCGFYSNSAQSGTVYYGHKIPLQRASYQKRTILTFDNLTSDHSDSTKFAKMVDCFIPANTPYRVRLTLNNTDSTKTIGLFANHQVYTLEGSNASTTQTHIRETVGTFYSGYNSQIKTSVNDIYNFEVYRENEVNIGDVIKFEVIIYPNGIDDTYIVDAKGNGDFTTVEAALKFIPDYQNYCRIFIRNGTYYPAPKTPTSKPYKETNRKVIIEGESRAKTILAGNVGYYDYTEGIDYALLRLTGDVTIKNLTLKNTSENYISTATANGWDLTQPHNSAYCWHHDEASTAGQAALIENCDLYNDHFACIGFGGRPDVLIKIKDCFIWSDVSADEVGGTSSFSSYSTIYGHLYSNHSGLKQDIWLEGCIVKNTNFSKCLKVTDASDGDYANISSMITAVRNTFKSTDIANSFSKTPSSEAGVWELSDVNYGNNATALNTL